MAEAVEGVTEHELGRSCNFPLTFFHATPTILHSSKTSFILLPFRVSYTLPRRLIFFTFFCSYPLYNSHQFLVPLLWRLLFAPFRISLPVTVFVHTALVDMIRLPQIIHKVVFLAPRFQSADWC